MTCRLLIGVSMACLLAGAASGQTLTVDTLEDRTDFGGARQVADLPGPDGRVSFREAVYATNNTPGPQTVEFAIPQSEWWLVDTMALLKLEYGVFLVTDDETTFDFSTQTDFTGDTNPDGTEVGIYGLEANGWGTPAIIVNADHCVFRGLGAVLVAVPSHVLGLAAIAVFALWARVLPPGGFGPGPRPDLWHLVLPVVVLSLHFLGRYLRFVETGLRAALHSEHLWAARARGLSEGRVVLAHGLPMVLLPLLPLVAQTLPTLFSGALLVERIFDFPGMGLLIHESITFGDLEVALVLALIYAALTMIASGLADLGHLWLDPRARQEEGR